MAATEEKKKGMFDFLKKKPQSEETTPSPVKDPTPLPNRKHSLATGSAASKATAISIKRNGKMATVDIIKLRRLLLEAEAADAVGE